jgi:putative ABC transport system permease protein
MNSFLIKNIGKSVLFYRKEALNQVIVVALLSAIITACLFTGSSVRSSLKTSALQRLGNVDIVISSGSRYFDASLRGKISDRTGDRCVSFLAADGYCQNLATGVTALNIKISGVTNDFFRLQGNDSVILKPGTVAINENLARHLGIKKGDDIIIRFKNIDPVPASAPFSPSERNNGSRVMKVESILSPGQGGNFSLAVSQIIPMNLFINISDLESSSGKTYRANRMLIQNRNKETESSFNRLLSEVISPSDIGLTLRKSAKTGETELISDRIFLDSTTVTTVLTRIPSAYPLITYLANSLSTRGKSTPYSFVTALPAQVLPGIRDDDIIINRWLADDLGAIRGDSLYMTWYRPAPGHHLDEEMRYFIIKDIVANDTKYEDPSYMPDFPGISGSTSCSSWDAGVPVSLDRIRKKDEDYWNKYKGTPKAFISYATGKRLWGNNFGTASALRFPEALQPEKISELLTGSFDPARAGFTITDMRQKAEKSATDGIDFSSLFLSLGIFIIVSCMILLSLTVSMFFETRKERVKTLYAIGFRNRSIRRLLFLETVLLSVSGALPGVFAGYLVNTLIIKALNTVWAGAVQTNTLVPVFSLTPVLAGFITTLIITSILFTFRIRKFLRKLGESETGELKLHSGKINLVFLVISGIISTVTIATSMLMQDSPIMLSFSGGSLLFVTFILLLRQYYLAPGRVSEPGESVRFFSSRKYYSFNPSHALMPVIFIAAGIFAVIITGANRQVISKKMLLPSGGTGGYLLWAEVAVPVKADLNTSAGRSEFGLDEEKLKDLQFIQFKRLQGDDASCLNLNHVSTPPLLGVNPSPFIKNGSFSFASKIKEHPATNEWEFLNDNPAGNTIFGMADQTVLEWGLKIKTGDTLKYRAENGQPLNIVICAGLKSSVFQGYLLIGENNFNKYFPSVPGSSIYLINGKPELSDYYRETISERFSGYGMSVEPASQKLASFFRVTNTYLDVFTVFGALGMVLGVAGLGIILLRNFNRRKKEFALMIATGYSLNRIRNNILRDEIIILFWGIITGVASAFTSTWPSLKSGTDMSWSIIIIMILAILITGLSAIMLSLRSVGKRSLVSQLRQE